VTTPPHNRTSPATKTKRATTPLPIGAPRRISVYVRRSTDDEHQPFSIDAQLAKLNSYIDSQLKCPEESGQRSLNRIVDLSEELSDGTCKEGVYGGLPR
jgi:hypothetical protein